MRHGFLGSPENGIYYPSQLRMQYDDDADVSENNGVRGTAMQHNEIPPPTYHRSINSFLAGI
jgi:hypothetical protein